MITKSIKQSNWKEVFLPEVVFFQEGPGVRNTQFTETGVKLLNVGNINKGQLNLKATKTHLSQEEAFGKYSHFLVDEGDLLIACSGIVVENFHNKIAFAEKEHLPLCLNTSTMRFRALDDQVIDLNFFKFYLQTRFFKDQLLRLITGSAQLNFGPSHIKKIKLNLPPLPQQQKIAAILDAADALRQNDKALITKYDELTQALFLDMFGDPVSNPKGWEKKLVEELCLNIVDCVNKTAPTVDFVTEYKMIRTPNVRNHSVNLESTRFVTLDTFRIWNRRLKPQRNDIVFTREAPVGEAGVILSDDQLMLGQRTMIYRVDESKVNNTYLLFQLMGSDVQRQISNISMGSTVKHLSVPSCKAFKILVPPIDLQNQFAERVTVIEQQKAIAQASLERSEELFNSLLQKAFKGELV